MFYADQPTSSLVEAWPGKHIKYPSTAKDPETRVGFIELCVAESQHARNTQAAFLSYQTAIEDQKAFSEEFYTSERDVTWTAVNQLEDVRHELASLVGQASALAKPDDEVAEELRVSLDYARCAASHHRNTIFANHVFYKVNWSLDINKTGIIPLKTLLIPSIEYYLKNKLGAQYWANPITQTCSGEKDGFRQFV